MFQGMTYVYEVYKEGSFSKAAQKLFISQPSLSASVKRVEDKVGYPIFDRSTKPLSLTECGEKYIDSVERIMAVQNEFFNYINDWGGLKTGSLTLGGSSLFASWVLPPLMAEFSAKYPDIRLVLVEENTSALEEMLQNGRLDFMLDNCRLDESVFEHRDYQEEHLLLAVPKGFAVNEKLKGCQLSKSMICDRAFLREDIPEVPLGEFAGEPFIILKPENDTRKRAMEIFSRQGLEPNILFEVDQQMTSYNITSSGMGISFISDTLVSRVPSEPEVVYYKLGGEISRRMLYFYWKSGRYFSRAMEEFLKIV